MKAEIMLRIAKLLYIELLRPLLIKAVTNTEIDIDNMLLEMCDKAFGYHTVPIEKDVLKNVS